jgi:nanoRNase/pAp phosphatase (c-di-AMP/oligoRNAs hydrolase)
MNQLQIGNESPQQQQQQQPMMSTTTTIMEEQRPPSVNERRNAPYNVVCTHITADFDTLASAIGLAKLWSLGIYNEKNEITTSSTNDIKKKTREKNSSSSIVHGPLPTYVVLPRGAHPDVTRFLSLHKHLFPIRSLKSLPGFTDTEMKKGNDNSNGNSSSSHSNHAEEGLQRVGLVDAQRRDRLGPADILLPYAKLGVTIVDHHVDAESDITEAKHFVVDRVGSVSTMIAERLRNANVEMTEAEATILALGIHSDTGSLVYDSTTPKDAMMLGWAMEMGASQTAIAEHAIPTLSEEQQTVLTQALNNINRTYHQGVTISTVLLSADGFIPGLATVTKDALDLSSSDIFLLAVCYEATRGDGGGGGGRSKGGRGSNNYANGDTTKLSKDETERLQQARRKTVKAIASRADAKPTVTDAPPLLPGAASHMINSESWKGGEIAFQRQRLAATFAFYDTDRSGFLSRDEIIQALTASGFLINQANFDLLYKSMDVDSNGKIDFEEFVSFYSDMEKQEQLDSLRAAADSKGKPMVMTIIGRVKAGVNVRNVNLNTLFQKFNGGGHPKAASATAKLENESDAKKVLQGLVDELIDASLEQQLTVGDFMQSPVLSAKPSMTEKQVEDLFMRYDVRALPVVDDDNCVIGLVSYKEVMAAKLRLLNKQEKRLRQMEKDLAEGKAVSESQRPLESALKGWMKQHVQTVEASQTMSEVENILLEADVGCIPVVADNTKQLIGMVTRTDLLRQHRYYSSLHYHNKGFSDSIAARKPIIELRKKLKKFDIE